MFSSQRADRFGPRDDQFQIKQTIDKGSQGEVFICTRLKNKANYAVKKIDIGTLEMRNKKVKVRNNLKREIDIMRELTHRRIVNLLEAFWNDKHDVCFIVMDLAEGGALHDKLVADQGLVGGEDASKYVSRQLLEGMGYMHEHQVVHRDLKPQNILITNSNQHLHDVKIADFGLSRCLNNVGGQRENMSAVGTPAFAAPEVLRGTYDEGADYWSFGCINYTMLCGQYPFEECPDHIRHPDKYKDGTAPKVYDCSSWRKASDDARRFTMGLLCVLPQERFGLNECLRHAWLAENQPADENTEVNHISPRPKKELEKKALPPTGVASWPLVQAERCCFPLAWPVGRAGSGDNQSFRNLRLEDEVRQGIFSKISGWSGTHVDSLGLVRQSERKPQHWRVREGGVKRHEWTLQKDEAVIAVRHELSGHLLGAAVIFYTSRCQIIAIQGTYAVKRRRFVAPVGWQVVGLQFENYRISGILMERIGRKGEGAVELISGNVGYAVDWVTFLMRDGTMTRYGREGGSMPEEYPLDKDEYIVIVEQGPRDGFIGNSIVFFLSSGRVIQFKGIAATQSLRYMTQPGDQICDMEFKDVGGGQMILSSVTTCPLDGDLNRSTVHAIEDPCARVDHDMSPKASTPNGDVVE